MGNYSQNILRKKRSACGAYFLPWDTLEAQHLSPLHHATPHLSSTDSYWPGRHDEHKQTWNNRTSSHEWLVAQHKPLLQTLLTLALLLGCLQGVPHLHFLEVCVGTIPRNMLSFKACPESKLRNLFFSVMACCSVEKVRVNHSPWSLARLCLGLAMQDHLATSALKRQPCESEWV